MVINSGHHFTRRLNNSFPAKHVDWLALISCALAFCVYLNTLQAGFVYDDSRAILTNKDVLQQETPWRDIWRDDFWGTPLTHSGSHKSFRPLTILSFRLNRYFSGFHPWSYHLTNVILHTITTWLFVRVARVVFNLSESLLLQNNDHQKSSSTATTTTTTRKSQQWTSHQNFALIVSSFLFASHPIHTEAVAGVVGRADVAATAFALSSFLAYANHVTCRNRRSKITQNHNQHHHHRHHQCPGQAAVSRTSSPSSSASATGHSSSPQTVVISSSSSSLPSDLASSIYFVISIAFAAAAMLTKEHGVMIIFICAVYDLILSLIRLRRYQTKSSSFWNLECCSSVILLVVSFVALFHLRLSVMGGISLPSFAKADNPIAHNPSFWTRTFSFLFLPIFNLGLLIYPHPLSYDWSMDAVPRVEKFSDSRNLLAVAFYCILLRRACLSVMKVNASLEANGQKAFNRATATSTSPVKAAATAAASCKICRFSVANHKCSNNNSIISPYSGEESNNIKATSSSSNVIQATPSKYSNKPVSTIGNSPKNSKTNNPSSSSSVKSLNSISTFSTSPRKSTANNNKLSSSVMTMKHSCPSLPPSSSLEHGMFLIELSFVILPFIPASNLLFYVGFVVAERVLYMPSVGFCLLLGHGFSQLYSKIERNRRRGGSFLKALCLAAFLASVVMMSLGTIRRNEDWRDEGRLYRAGIAVNPPKSWGNLGNVLNSQGRVGEAEEAYRQALRFRPNMAEVHYNLGLVLERQGKTEEALASYRTAIHFRPQLASAYVNGGQLLTRLGRINQAMDMYRRCFNLHDEGVKDLRTHIEAKVSALLRFGKLLIEVEDAPKAAVNVYRQAVRIMPPDYEQKQSVYNAIGEALFRIGEITEAESWFLQALKTKPDHVPAHLTYGKMLARNKTRLLEAERWFRRAKKIAPQDSSVYHHYGQFLAVQGRHSEAAKAYVTAATLSPNDYDIVVGAANALRQSGNNREAEVYYEKAVALRSQEARAHMNLGAILHVNGKYYEAEQSYLMALRLKPSDDVTLLNLRKLRQLQARRNQFAMSCKNKNRVQNDK